MVEDLDLAPDDRVLLLSLPSVEILRRIAAQLKRGGVVGLGGRDEVYEARRAVRDLVNVMLHPGPPEDIPFRDGFFTKVIGFECRWSDAALVALETARVLAGEGRAYLSGLEEPQPFRSAGLDERPRAGRWTVFEKPPDPPRPAVLPVIPGP
ncbi:MAG TPA: hypothetical protein ENK13_02350 [Thermopetrobacter sp.]|nr:hypothetical protein [Thermopetrobacter sp.]